MCFISYPHLILLISGQTFEVTVAYENFWELNGASVLNMFLLLKVNQLPAPSKLFVCYLNSFMIRSRLRLLLNTLKV